MMVDVSNLDLVSLIRSCFTSWFHWLSWRSASISVAVTHTCCFDCVVTGVRILVVINNTKHCQPGSARVVWEVIYSKDYVDQWRQGPDKSSSAMLHAAEKWINWLSDCLSIKLTGRFNWLIWGGSCLPVDNKRKCSLIWHVRCVDVIHLLDAV